MKTLALFALFGLLVVAIVSCSCSGNTTAGAMPAVNTSDAKSRVLVELFTSEGCSSCPPADRLLGVIEATDKRAIMLEFHVDYWDSPEWKDKFSSPLYSERQEVYGKKFAIDQIYTPQMVIDGSTQFVGSDSKGVGQAIADSAKKAKATLDLRSDGRHLKIDVDGLPGDEVSTIYFAVAESDLLTHITGGENEGVSLRHSSVVRSLSAVGAVEKDIHKAGLSVDLPTDASWNLDRVRFVVFIQENTSRRVVAAADLAAKQ